MSLIYLHCFDMCNATTIAEESECVHNEELFLNMINQEPEKISILNYYLCDTCCVLYEFLCLPLNKSKREKIRGVLEIMSEHCIF